MPAQDFLQRLRQQQQSQPLEVPEYDLPSQVPSVQVDPVQQVFGDGHTTKQAPKSPVLNRRLPEGSPFETYGDVQDWNPSAPIQDLKQLGGLLKLRRQLNNPATFRSQPAKRKKPQQQPPVTAEGAFGRSVPGQPGSYYPADTSARVNPFDLNQPSEAEQMGNRALVGAGESAPLPQARTLFDRIRNEQARDAAYRSPKQTQLRLEGVDTGQTKLNLPPSSLQQLEGIDTGETQIDPAALQRAQRDKLEKRDGRFVAGLLNPAAQLANTLADAGITAPQEMSESFFPTLTKGLASIPEGFARIGDKILNVGSLAQTNAIRKIAEMHPEWSPEEKAAAANQIQQLEGNLSNAGDYFEKGLTKPVAAAADYLYPDDSPVEKSINPLKRGFWTRTMPEAGASMLPFVAASGVGAGLGLAPELVAGLSGAAMEVPDQYHEARAAGATPEQLARTVDAASLAGGLESVGAESLLGKVGLKGKSLPGYVLKEGVQEAAQEGAQQGVEDLGSKYYSKINPKLAWSQIGENMLQNAVPAFFLGVGGGALSSGSRHQEAAQQIEQLAATEPDHPIVQVIAQAGIDPATISQADDRAMDELSKRLQAMARMNSQVQQLQGTREVLQQQVQNAQDAQLMGRVPSTVEQSQIQQLPAVEQELAVAEQGQAALVQDLQENVSPLFQNLAKAIGQKDVQPLTDVKDDPQADLVKEVRKAGGFDASPGAIESGELERLSPKELGSTGLIRREGGVKPDTLRQDMVSEGLSNAETPSEFIDEVESAARREKTDDESYSDYQRSKMTPEEQKDSDQLEEVLKDRAHPFTRMYRTLESPKTIYTKELARKFVQEADKLGFSDDFIERTLIEAQQRGGMGATVEKPVAETSPRPVKSSGEPGKSISLSPYKVLEVNNKDLLKELYNTNLNSKEGKEGIQALREYADEKGIEQRHVDAHISDIQNWQKKYGVPKSQPSAKPKLLLKPQPKIEEAAPASSLGFNPDQRKLLGRDHTNILDSEFDEYMGQVEELQNLSVRGKEHGGFDISEAERKGLVSKILEIRQERRKRVKAGRLQALSGSHTKPTETKANLGKELVEQSQNETGIDQAAHEAATSPKNDLPQPTEAQKEAGNYKKGHINIHGLDITIENPKGSVRSGTDANGKPWEVEMSAHYGYIKRTVGADEEQIDVYIGPGGENTDKVFVVDQVDAKTGQFDEHKVILGAADKRSAEVLYDAHFDDGKGPDRRGAVTEMSVEQFKDWLKTEDNTKPVASTAKVPLEPSKTEAPKVEVSESKKTDSGLVPLPKVGDVKESDGRAYTLERVQRIGQGEDALDFELWSSEFGWTMLTRDAESGEALPGSIITDTNEDRIKRRFRNKTEEYRFSSNKNASVEVADLSGGKVSENGAEAESGETVERGDAETVSPGALPDNRAGRIAVKLLAGNDLSGIQAVRKQFGVQSGTEEAKRLEEDIEFAGVLAARQIVAKNMSVKETYQALLELHNRIPNLNTRTSESVRDQAYSTPLPIAYVASRLAGIDAKTSVYEPTGGNGALVMEASPENTTINDLNPQRVENLRQQGFEANKADATKVSLGAKVDVVIANPPFGIIKENGQSKQFDTKFGTTTEIDHAIAFKALEAMADDGKAVLIVGGVNRLAKTREARSDAYNQAAKRRFYSNLYDNYNVVDHFTVDGQMYAKQGAAWPVDVIVIDGKGKSARKYPAVNVPEIVKSYEELGNKISDKQVLDSTRESSTQLSEGATAKPGRLPGFDEPANTGNAQTGKRSSTSGTGRIEPTGSGVRSTTGAKTGKVDGKSSNQSTLLAEPGPKETKGETKPSVPKKPVRESKPTAVGERTDSGTGRTSELDKMFEEEFADMFGEPEPKGFQPAQAIQLVADSIEQLRKQDVDRLLDETLPRHHADLADYIVKNRKDLAKAVVEAIGFQETAYYNELAGVAKEQKTSLKESADALMDLFGDKPGKSGPPASRRSAGFDEALYQKAKPQFENALSSFEGVDDRTAIRKLLEYLKANYGERAEAAIYRMKPYIIQFVEDRAEQVGTKPETKPEPRTKQVISEQSESSHAAYEPLSTARSLNVAVPKNMSASVKKALTSFEERHGSPDEYVADKLGYKQEEVSKFFSAEQVDALALAVDNIEQGKGFVIGDQTGIGKGRINAGIIRYAIKNGKTPVFVTQKPALYADMIRDLKDIGMENIRPLITNSGEAIPLNDAATEWMHAVADAKANGEKSPSMPKDAKIFRAKPDHVATLEQVGMSGKLKGYDVVFTTYDQMNPMGGLFNKERHAAVSGAVRGGVLIMDESHTAGGVAPAGRGKPTPSRSKFFRGLVNAAGSVFYSSATYAKRPDVMDLYSKTDLGLLGKTGDALTELFSRGGVALQQVVASKLSEAGQYLRRERTFDGITYSPEVVETSKKHAENVSTAMRMIVGFDQAKRDAVRNLKEEVKNDAALASEDGSIGAAGVDSSNFTSLMHNVIDQMLLGLKADQAAAQAIKAIQNGEKPVLTVSNTMESFLKDAGLSPGDAVDLTFKDVLHRYLLRSRDVVIKDRDGKKVRRPLSDDELGPKGIDAYQAVEDFINDSDFGEIPISPIDRVRELIEKAGYKVDEITGRGTRVDSTGKIPILRARSAQDTKVAGRRRVIGDFNSGRIDALILNQAGSTGISLHASPATGKDLKPRHMIIWQAEKNIDTHMQMLGRVNRTGQVTLPRYTQMIADVPAEKRPAAVLLKKMASLSANTTASRKSAVQTEGVTDFINELGDEVVARLLTQDAELNTKLGDPLEWDGPELSKEGAARKVSGRIPLLTLAEQQEVYERIESEYADFLAQKEAMGENPLEARTEDFKAETMSTQVLTEGIPGSPFSEPAYLEKVKINRTVKPYTSAEVSAMVRENLGLPVEASESDVQKTGKEKVNQFVRDSREAYEAYKKSLTDGIAPDDARSQAAALGQVQKVITTANHWNTVARVVTPGAMVTINTDAGSVSGVVLDVTKRGKPKNPVALGSWVVRLAVLDGRELRLSFNELINREGILKVGQSPGVNRLNPETGMFESRPMLPEFDASQGMKKQIRYMVTGNIVSGYAKLPKGQILNYTDADGSVKQGVLLPANFDAAKTMAEMPVELTTASQVMDYLDQVYKGSVSDPKQEITIVPSQKGTDLEIRVLSSKSIGGKYYLDSDLTAITGNFVKSGGLMKVNIDRAKLPAVMSWLKEQGIGLNASNKEAARKMLGLDKKTPPPAARRTRESVENSPEFKRWFGKSKVVDTEGNPVPVYHGTQSPVEIGEVNPEKFDSDGLYGPGFYTTQSSDVAAGEGGYALTKGHRESMPVEGKPHAYKLYLRIENPFDIEKQFSPEEAAAFITKTTKVFTSPDMVESMSGSQIYRYLTDRFKSKDTVNKALTHLGFDGITHLGGKLQGTIKEFGFARLRAEEYAKEVGGTVSRDPDTGEYEVKGHRVWIAFEPNQVKSFFNRGTFDDSANLSTARRKPTGPASELTNPLDVFLHAETLLKSRGSRGVRMYVNDHARAILGASLTEVFGTDYTNVSSINLSRSEVKQIADYLENSLSELEATHQPGAKQFIADLREMLAKGKNQRTFNIVDVTPFEQRHASGLRGDKDRATEAFKGDVREETFHWSQREIDGDSIALVGSSWAQSSKGYGKYRKALIKLGYPDDAETIAAETAAKIAAGKFEDLDIRTDADHEQAQNWLASYFERVAERHGVEALDKFGSLLPKAKEALKKGEKSVKERLRERVEENQQATSGARPRASGREGERIQGSDDGRSANGAQKVRPRSADEPFESSAPVKGPQIPISEQTNTANVRQPGEKAPEFQSVKGARVQPKMFSEGEPSDEWAEPLDEDSIKQESLFGKDGQPKRSWRDVWDITSDIVNIPKALRASQDLSAMFRQGFYMGVPHPVKFGKSAVRQVKSLRKSEYKKFYQWLRRHPAYQDALAAGLEFSSDGKMTVNEENFGTRFAGKIPGIAMAERAFVTFLDSMRIELFDLYRKSLKKQIPNLAEQFEGMQASAEWINKTSGRAHFGKGRFGSWMKETGIPFLNFFGWSPRYVYSRMQMLNPATYLKNLKNPQRRIVFARQMTELFSTSAVLVATGALAKAAGATISFDPDDPDFLKLRFGTTRYDVLAGLQQSARLAIQIGKWVRSRGEEDDKKRRNVSQETVKDTLRFARTKLAPVPGFFVDWLNDWVKVTGEQHKPGQFWGKMKNGEWAQSAAEAVNDPVLSLGLSLMFSTAVEAWVKGYKGGTLYGDESDALKGLIKVGQIVPFEFVGFGVQDYDRPEWKKRTRELFEQFDLDPGFPKRKPEETEPAYQKRVRAHIAEQESAVESFAGDTNLIGQPLERQKTLLKQEMSDDGRERMAKLRPEDVADDRMVRAWIQVGLERLKANPLFQQMSESEQKHAIQSYYGRMNTYKAQPKNKMHGYQRPEVVDETIIQRKIKEAIKAQQGN